MSEPAMPSDAPPTFFAPAGRDSPEAFSRKVAMVRNRPLLIAALDAIPGMVMVLNTNRQIIAANQAMQRVLRAAAGDLLEKRPGEVVGCVRPKQGPDGCGTSRFCVTCGAVNAILESQYQNVQVVRECRILTEDASGPGALDLRVAATPIDVEGERFVVVAVEDISQQKRMSVLQRVFFHDVLNTAGCILGYADYLAQSRDAVNEVSDLLIRLSEQLVEEIHAQRDLVLAEAGDLEIRMESLMPRQMLDDLRQKYLRTPVAEGRTIVLGHVWDGTITTDRRLLARILGNMLKNALEATRAGGTVTIACFEREQGVEFAVHNPGVIPADVQLQMFQRSFSTKGQPGRGVGTYSMKLLGERYLGGQIDFVSREPEGTTFRLRLPKGPHPENASAQPSGQAATFFSQKP